MPAEVYVIPIFHTIKWDAKNDAVVSTVSRAGTWSSGLSPFLIGPCDLYGGFTSSNMENAWQFSKVYKEHLKEDGEPNPEYWRWAITGWADTKAHRYPMGKGRKPVYSFWDREHLDYIQARKRIYGPLYAEAVKKTNAWKELNRLYRTKKKLILLDYDAYDHRRDGVTLTDVLNNPNKKMGHAFVLAMLLTKDKALKQMKLRS